MFNFTVPVFSVNYQQHPRRYLTTTTTWKITNIFQVKKGALFALDARQALEITNKFRVMNNFSEF